MVNTKIDKYNYLFDILLTDAVTCDVMTLYTLCGYIPFARQKVEPIIKYWENYGIVPYKLSIECHVRYILRTLTESLIVLTILNVWFQFDVSI